MTDPSLQPPRIQLRQVSKTFDAFTAVEPLDLAIRQGEFVVLLGPSGCGKTTTLRMIAGLESPSSGSITISGKDVTHLRPGDRDIAFVFQLFALYPHLTAEQNIAFPLRAARLPKAEIQKRVDDVIRRLNLESLRRRRPRTLSGGDQQRVSLARAMVRQPAAFLMDEPLGTLDADQREHTRLQLRAIHNELAATTVFVTHDQLEAMSLADRIAIMHNGKLLQFAPPREVYDHPATLFVANFIGSPGMNFLPTTRTSPTTCQIDNTPHQLSARPNSSSSLSSHSFVLGIRPEHIHLAPPTAPSALPVTVEHTERLGSYNLLELRLGPHALKARVPAQHRFSEGEKIHIHLSPTGLRWFDPSTGQTLPAAVKEAPHARL